VEVRHARLDRLEVFDVARHAGGHAVPPHRIRHRANVEALARCRVDRVVALNAVGALDPAIAPGDLVVPDDYLDLSGHPERTFYDDAPVHVDVAEAYCPRTRRALVDAAREAGLRFVDGGVYVAAPGPRLETRAEVRALKTLGGTVVGMTGCPEAALARERCLCYASLCVVANAAAGLAAPLPADRIREAARASAEVARRVVLGAAARLPPAGGCACAEALAGARL
ncbi:MAG TPA: MTAP family purine nucleoside phosphorylase, partial [Candidatus Thermoplasmatota archaeon]|nr:MTAP family purine nucleoside phosphorylase [Candidatus Thermoplasmatota archaeon]